MTPLPLKLLSSMATRDVLREMVSRYQADTARAVDCEAAGGLDVAKRVQGGEAVDIVVLASNAIDKLIEQQKLIAGSRVDLVRSGIAVAVRANSPRPEVGTEDAVKMRRAGCGYRELLDRSERRLSGKDVRTLGHT